MSTPFSLNRYTYALNNPIRYWDPNGRQSADSMERQILDERQRILSRPAPVDRVQEKLDDHRREWNIPTSVPAGKPAADANNDAALDNFADANPVDPVLLALMEEFDVFVEEFGGGVRFATYGEDPNRVGIDPRLSQFLGQAGLDLVHNDPTCVSNGQVGAKFGYDCSRYYSGPEAAATWTEIVVGGARFIFFDERSCKKVWSAGCGVELVSLFPVAKVGKVLKYGDELVFAAKGADLVETAADLVKKAHVDAVLRTATAACRKKKSSFVPGTPVLLATGETKPIEDIEVGDRVWAADPETGETGPRAVTQLISSAGAKVLVDVDVDGDGQADVAATDEHPFWVDNLQAWVNAIDLKLGDLLVTPEGATVDVDATSHRHVGYQQVHNLTIDGIHTYHITAGDESVLVHNSGCDDLTQRGLAGLADSGSINPSSVRFSQDSIRRGFSDGNGTMDDLIAGLRSGSVDPGEVPVIRILERNGQIFTLDNRRLHAFQEAGVDIRYRWATATEIADESWKFTTKNGGTSIRIRGG